MKKPRLGALATQMGIPPRPDERKIDDLHFINSQSRTVTNATSATDAVPAWGERGDFVRATITLPPALYAQLLEESTRRKVAHSGDGSVSSIVRDALMQYLSAGPHLPAKR